MNARGCVYARVGTVCEEAPMATPLEAFHAWERRA